MLLGPLWQLGVLHDDDDDGRCLGSRRGLSWQLEVSDDDDDDDTKDFQGRCWRRKAYGGDGPMAEDSPVTKVQNQHISFGLGMHCVSPRRRGVCVREP